MARMFREVVDRKFAGLNVRFGSKTATSISGESMSSFAAIRSKADRRLTAKSRRSLVLDNLLESGIIYPRPVISSP
jgi:hypothetical protein